MKIVESKSLSIPSVKAVRFSRFTDFRGYFTEPFRKSDVSRELEFLKGIEFYQLNESYSRPGVVRGLHFQWNPHMGKLVRTVRGRMVDIFLDIRLGSPTFGKAGMCDMPSSSEEDCAQWIWIPPGFAHGNYFTRETVIEYFCSGEYSPGCEAGISPLSGDIDWSLCDPGLKAEFDSLLAGEPKMTDKDRSAFTLSAWAADERSRNFLYGELGGA